MAGFDAGPREPALRKWLRFGGSLPGSLAVSLVIARPRSLLSSSTNRGLRRGCGDEPSANSSSCAGPRQAIGEFTGSEFAAIVFRMSLSRLIIL